MASADDPKIIIDSDWKSQAQAEKDRLAGGPKPDTPAPGAGATPPTTDRAPGGPARFEDLLSILYTQALAYLGAFPDPRTGRAVVALDLAKLHVDLLALLQDKTKGNLTEQESSLLTRVVHELRLEYVEIAKEVAKAVQEGRATTVPSGGAAPGVAPGPSLDLRPGAPKVH